MSEMPLRYTAQEITELRAACQDLYGATHPSGGKEGELERMAETMLVTYMANGTRAAEVIAEVDRLRGTGWATRELQRLAEGL